jgi:predicted Zn finger-like uncharacterized protein
MDVRCNRCATEYDFDDALISERGTTVKCTNCGYQFKVFPPDAGALAPERWVVRTANGEEYVFTSLRELQRGISEQKVGANDLLSRGRQPPRPLGSIAELEQFFLAPRAQERVQRTLHGVAPPGGPGTAEPAPASPATAPLAPPDASAAVTEKFGRRSVTAPLGTLPESEPITPSVPEEEPPETSATASIPMPAGHKYAGETLAIPPPQQRPAPAPAAPPTFSSTLQSAGVEPPVSRRLGSQPELGAPLGQLSELRSSGRNSGPISLPGGPPPSRRDLRSYDELSPESMPDPSRRARSRWIAAVVVAGVLTLFALTVGRRYLVETRASGEVPVQTSNARVAALLKSGTRLLDEGQLEEAGEELTRATALAEKDPDVLAALARLAVLRADVSWLRLRLLDPKVEELVQVTHRELGRGIGKARAAVDAAFAVAPENIVVLRARVDALRLSGDHDTAREWIKPIASQPSDPPNAYVLAALDLAESTPSWPAVIDRLKTAVSGERAPGRAHVALVYALTRAGRLSEAESELAKLEANPNAVALIDELKSFVARNRQTGDAGVAEKNKAVVDPAKLGRPEPLAPAAGSPNASAGDFRKLLEQAAQAMRRGDMDRAKGLYEQVLTQQPGNTEALAGLGDIARHRNDPAVASRMYEKVLADNPNYLPALLASADQKWEAGDRKGALALYRRVLDQAGASTEYGQRASSRIAQAERAEAAPAPESDAPAPAPSPSAAPRPSEPQPPPSIDTTDLPELK